MPLQRRAGVAGEQFGIVDQRIGEFQRRLLGVGQLGRGLVAIGDVVHHFLAEALRHRLVEADIAAEPAFGDARIAHPRDFLDPRREHVRTPEPAIEREEALRDCGLVGEHRAEMRRLSGNGGG